MEKNIGTSTDIMWQLEAVKGNEFPYFLKKGQVLIGRADTCDLVIKDASTSSLHACITLQDDEVLLVDMGSTNGTFVNDKEIEKHSLKPNDIIRFGIVEYVLKERQSSGTAKINLNDLKNLSDMTQEINLDELGFKSKGDVAEKSVPEGKIVKSKTESLPGTQGEIPNLGSMPENKSQMTKTFVIDENFEMKEDKVEVASIAPPPVTSVHSDDLAELEELLEGKEGIIESKGSRSADVEVFTLVDIDPNIEYSEFIFEDKEEVHPVFNYDIHKRSVEVMVLIKDTVLSVSYFPLEKNCNILAVGKKPDAKRLLLDTFPSRKKQRFLRIRDEEVTVLPIEDHSSLYFSISGKILKNTRDEITVVHGDFLQFNKDEIRVFVRLVSAPPKVVPPPFMGRDKELKKYAQPIFAIGLLVAIFIQLIEVNREVTKEKTSERIAKILYKRPKPRPTPRPVSSRQKDKSKDQSKKEPDLPEKVAKMAKDTPKKQKAVSKTKGRRTVGRKQKKKQVYKKMNFAATLSAMKTSGGKIKAKTFKFNLGANLGLASSKSLNLGKVEMASIEGKMESLMKGQTKMSRATGAAGLANKKGFSFPKVFKKTVVLGSMDPEEVREILGEYIPFFRHCYDQELERHDTKVKGTMQLNFIIGASGRVTKSWLKLKNMRFTKVGKKCIKNVLKGIQFPKPKGGGTVEIKQPLNFEAMD